MSVVKNSRSWPLKKLDGKNSPRSQATKQTERNALNEFFSSTISSSYMQFYQIWWSILEVQLILSL